MNKENNWCKKHPIWFTIICIVSIFIICSVIFSGDGAGSNINEFDEHYKIDKTMACIMTQGFVEDVLKAPSTAKFQNCYDASVNYQGGQIYYVHTYVDSQNGFGAMIRTQYSMEIRDNQDKTWTKLDFYTP